METGNKLDEKVKLSRDEVLKRISEIQKKEDELKKKKLILQRQKPWYTQASNVIGLLTIIITVAIAAFSFIANEESLVVDCVYSEAEPFTNISPSISNKVAVYFNDSPTENIGKVKFRIINNGTKAVKKNDFVDGPIEFKIRRDSKTIKSDSANVNAIPLLLDVVKIRNANQRNDIVKIKSRDNISEFTYMPSLLNPGESVEIEALLSNINDLSLEVNGNIADGTFKVLKQFEEADKSNYLLIGESIINFLGAKWIALTLLIIFFLLSILKSMLVFSEFEKIFLDYIFGSLFIMIDLSFLALIVSVIMN